MFLVLVLQISCKFEMTSEYKAYKKKKRMKAFLEPSSFLEPQWPMHAASPKETFGEKRKDENVLVKNKTKQNRNMWQEKMPYT